MYETPIKLTEVTKRVSDLFETEAQKLAEATKQHTEDYITFKIEQILDCEVDKEELIKAMQYDRNQYDKGYQDGYLDGVRDGKQILINKLQEYIEGSDEDV